MNTKRKVVLAAVLIVSHVAFYVLGGVINRRVMLHAFAVEVKKANAAVDLGLYMDYRYTALAIKEKRYGDALCAAQLGASGRYDDLKACLADENCRPTIEQELRKDAPEVLGEAPLKFTYIATKDGIRSCEKPSSSQRMK
jgi:hypothetical protein